MSAHDDFMDVRSAWEAYDRAYVAWGRAVDGTLENGLVPAADRVQMTQATKMAGTLKELIRASQYALTNMAERGWRTEPKRRRKAKK